MLKHEIEYTDFNGDQQKKFFYFNLSEAEIVEMQIAERGGLERYLQGIIESQDTRKLIDVLKSFIRASYGVRSDDGSSFIKREEDWLEFKGSGAYDVLFMDLFRKEGFMLQFVRGFLPEKYRDIPDSDNPQEAFYQKRYEAFIAQGMSEAEARSRAQAAASHLPAQEKNQSPTQETQPAVPPVQSNIEVVQSNIPQATTYSAPLIQPQ